MRKFKLILEYPNSPPKGTIVKETECCNKYWYSDNKRPVIFLKHWVENQPKYWQEIVKKDYEILSFKHSQGFTTLRDNGYYVTQNSIPQHCPNGKGASLDEMLNNEDFEDYKIHSVKRLSDDEVFTVGDNTKYGYIDAFYIKNNYLMVTTVLESMGRYLIDIILLKEPLFKTEDGVDIFEGDKCWGVVDTYPWKVYQVNTTHDLDWIHKLTFSTKKAAEEYILMNKPCLSFNDIKNVTNDGWNISHGFLNNLKKLVKSKL